ncbi:hypothetical protein R3P38DRAFT_3181826 [Favolaschia claudopus]|uniref:Uncharacterized protein n=1 Tax=Favolaschia claudopus TaxID=2862362 RepID=A0AAW0CKB4_9AGAR
MARRSEEHGDSVPSPPVSSRSFRVYLRYRFLLSHSHYNEILFWADDSLVGYTVLQVSSLSTAEFPPSFPDSWVKKGLVETVHDCRFLANSPRKGLDDLSPYNLPTLLHPLLPTSPPLLGSPLYFDAIISAYTDYNRAPQTTHRVAILPLPIRALVHLPTIHQHAHITLPFPARSLCYSLPQATRTFPPLSPSRYIFHTRSSHRVPTYRIPIHHAPVPRLSWTSIRLKVVEAAVGVKVVSTTKGREKRREWGRMWERKREEDGDEGEGKEYEGGARSNERHAPIWCPYTPLQVSYSLSSSAPGESFAPGEHRLHLPAHSPVASSTLRDFDLVIRSCADVLGDPSSVPCAYASA